MSTGQQIFNGALAKSSKNEPTNFGVPETVRRLNDRLDGLFHIGTRINPVHFGVVANIAEVAGTWARDAAWLNLHRIESGGTEVVVVPVEDQQAEPSKLSLYEWGATFNAITNSAGTPAGALDFYASTAPTPIAALVDAIDTRWPESMDELFVLELAIDFAVKDGRLDEESYLVSDRNEWLQKYVAFLQHRTGNLRRRFGNRQNINIEQLIPILAGGRA